MKHRKIVLAAAATLLVGALLMAPSRTQEPGLKEGRLRSCPKSPNCVCSQDLDAKHRVAPLEFTGSALVAQERLLAVVKQQPRARIITTSDTYLHAEFRSALFRFVDDVEFLLDPDAGLIHVRSASRLGYSDLGANRRRVERMRTAFEIE